LLFPGVGSNHYHFNLNLCIMPGTVSCSRKMNRLKSGVAPMALLVIYYVIHSQPTALREFQRLGQHSRSMGPLGERGKPTPGSMGKLPRSDNMLWFAMILIYSKACTSQMRHYSGIKRGLGASSSVACPYARNENPREPEPVSSLWLPSADHVTEIRRSNY
jgi:hypothetical protein